MTDFFTESSINSRNLSLKGCTNLLMLVIEPRPLQSAGCKQRYQMDIVSRPR